MTKTIDLDKLDTKSKPGAFSTYDMEILVPEVEKLKPGQVYLEIGVDKGKSLSVARMVAQEGVFVIGVDLRPNPKVPNTLFYKTDSTKFDFRAEVNVLFIDGDHSYEGCKGDIDNWYPQMAEHGVMLFHDCDRSSPGVVKAVKEFVKNTKQKDVFYATSPKNEKCSMARIRL